MSQSMTLYIAPFAGVISLLFALIMMISILKESKGNIRMQEISQAIYEGAMAFLNRQYRTLIPFTLVIAIVLYIKISTPMAISFLVGAICSALSGYIGMNATTKANSRTCEAARNSLNKALSISFRAGTVMGMSVAGLGLLGVSVLYLIYRNPSIINSFAFGASAIAFFARVGGGIYTKAADIGADLVGKVEIGIPEDDPRNPAVIADNVGDNVGDTAGMGADLFESYGATTIAAMLLGNNLFGINGVLFPLLLGSAGIFASMISMILVRTNENGNPQNALNKGIVSTNIILMIVAYFLSNKLFIGFNSRGIFIAAVSGLVVNIAIGKLTEYYTSHEFAPTRKIAYSSSTGEATTIIAGIANGLKSTGWIMSVLVIAIGVSYYSGGGIYGISVAAMAMLSTSGMVVAVDSFGPVVDNAGGIAEMAKLGSEVRKRTDRLDAVGNTTAAMAKGFAIGSAALTALALFSAYSEEIIKNHKLSFLLTNGHMYISITDTFVLIGMFIGSTVPFLVCAQTMEAVSRAAVHMINEVRRQFKEIPGIMKGEGKPNYARCVDISTKSALTEMTIPGLLAVFIPLLVGFILGAKALAGFLAGITSTGILLAIFMANSGGSWDNAKKFIEKGNLGGKGTKAHAAAVVGDTVGDPFKDTAGPAMNPLIKVAGTIALLIAPLLFH